MLTTKELSQIKNKEANWRRQSIGRRLKRLRLERGLSQRELATEHVSFPYISRLERGQRNASIKALRELAEKLQVTPLYLELGNVRQCPHCGCLLPADEE